MNRVLIAGTGSGSGKTTIVCGLCRCFQNMNLNVHTFKCGPDYIDSMFHSRVLGVNTGNLDSWFCDASTVCEILHENGKNSDISLIEGVMGYYDGVGFSTKASAYEIADITQTPVILVIDCHGMSTSINAVLSGFAGFKENSHIKGVIFNRLSERLYPMAAKMAESLGIEPLGYMPYKKESVLESRHLGLVTAEEIKDFNEKINNLAGQMKETIDLQGILKLSEGAGDLKICEQEYKKYPVRIAVAKDSAFCFLYKDNMDFLKKAGCEIVYFSPLNDVKLPENIHGLILSGGYPELFAKRLSDNISMRESIYNAVNNGFPTIAECGGFLYLHDELEDNTGKAYQMAGVIHAKGCKTQRLQRFGYMTMKAESDNLLAKKGEEFTAHEFHYWSSTDLGTAFSIKKAADESVALGVHATKNLYAGFPHIYFYGNRKAAENFLQKAYDRMEKKDEFAINTGD